MTNFVLLHGAWHGGWCWKYVAAILRARGHRVTTPTQTGLGERAHLMSPEIDLAKRELKRFLSEEFYHHPHVVERTRKAARVVGELFQTYRAAPSRLPAHVQTQFEREGMPRAISDYIAGMTDRFAIDELAKISRPVEAQRPLAPATSAAG